MKKKHKVVMLPTIIEVNWMEEMRKCKDSPYYLFTTYMVIDGKPCTTHLDEEQFNKWIKDNL